MVYFDFMRSSYDVGVYMKSPSVGYLIYLVSYVDDILIASSDLLRWRLKEAVRESLI